MYSLQNFNNIPRAPTVPQVSTASRRETVDQGEFAQAHKARARASVVCSVVPESLILFTTCRLVAPPAIPTHCRYKLSLKLLAYTKRVFNEPGSCVVAAFLKSRAYTATKCSSREPH